MVGGAPGIAFSKPAGNLVGITLAFAELVHGGIAQLLGSYGNVEWAQKFTGWANEFEELQRAAGWDSVGHGGYHEKIRGSARKKILEAAGMDEN